MNRSLNLLYPPFRARIEQALALAHGEKLMAYVFEAWRSPERQAQLYAQGRTAPGKIVTYAKPGESWHAHGVAVDLVFDGSPAAGVQWNWEGDYVDGKRGDYERLAKIVKAQPDIEWLGDKNIEMAHFQMSLGVTISEAKRITEKSGILALWAEFDKRLAK